MPVNGSSTMLLGPTGSGKTYCLRTFIDCGITPFILSTEPGIESTLGDVPKDKLHWHYIAPGAPSWSDLITTAKRINQLSYESLAKLTDINKRSYTQFIDWLESCNNFVCDRTGEEFGDIANWGPDRAFVADSLTGMSMLAMHLVIGAKPTRSLTDWLTAQEHLESTITKLLTSLNCYFVLTGHVEREQDEVTGGVKLMPSTLGRKLAPKLGRFFDDVVYCRKEGDRFYWSTTAMNVDLKSRNLPFSDNLDPTFRQIVEARAKLES